MQKFAGVTLDYYDDGGAFIKTLFPELDQIPDVIKTANVKPFEQVPDEQYALVALNNGHTLKKYACTDPGTTAMSVMYFLEHGNKLPEDAQKLAAHNLFEACVKHNILPPEQLTKIAADPVSQSNQNMSQGPNQAVTPMSQAVPATSVQAVNPPSPPSPTSGEKSAAAVDITGQKPKAKFAAAPIYDEDYAVVTEDGERKYPIHDWDHIKQACDYWELESRRMHPAMRRQFAVKVAGKAVALGFPLRDPTLIDAGAPNYADDGHVKASMEMRKIAMVGSDNAVHRAFVDELVEKTATLNPEVFAECVRQFDVMHGLDAGWDHILSSPWESTFGMQKTAKVVWEHAADRVTIGELNNLARNNSGALRRLFSDDFVKGYENDPMGVFNALPLPQKVIVARLANDLSADGGSSMSSYNDEDPKETAGDRPPTKVPG